MMKGSDIMAENYSPLRYPGGKAKLAPLIEYIIQNKTDKKINTYIEPFAGGAGVALNLLIDGIVNNIIINDYDKAIYSFWKSAIFETQKFLDKIDSAELTIDEWKKQREIYDTKNNKYSFELGFATFYLNRTNRSGILKAGPIGGYQQTGNYLIDARFNKEILKKKIERIAQFKRNIKIYNKDIRSFISLIITKNQDNSFVYFDPPYFTKGKALYINYFLAKDHEEILNSIKSNITKCPWLMTYDNEPKIEKLYSEYLIKKYELMYSLANKGKSSELIIFADESLCPQNAELKNTGINIVLF